MKNKPEYYYDDPFKAIWMIEKYGVKAFVYATEEIKKFGVPDTYNWMLHGDSEGHETNDDYEEVTMILEAISYIKENTPDKIYVTHKDPEFFEPKAKDILSVLYNNRVVHANVIKKKKDFNLESGARVLDFWSTDRIKPCKRYPIVERDGKHFFMPKFQKIKAN